MVVHVQAAQLRVAEVVGARVPVVAADERAADALPVQAEAGARARVVVVAGERVVVGVHAAGGGITAVGRARVAVVAVDGRAGLARAAAAGVRGGASVAVVTGSGVGGVDAARGGTAGVGGADVPVIAVGRRTAHARAVRARVGRGAGVAVVAGRDREAGHGTDGARPVAGA